MEHPLNGQYVLRCQVFFYYYYKLCQSVIHVFFYLLIFSLSLHVSFPVHRQQ